MENTHKKPDVMRISPAHQHRVVDVLCDSFREYPALRYVLGHEDGQFEDRLKALVGFFVKARAVRGEPLLGIAQDGRLLAAATVSFPGRGQAPADFASFRETVWQGLGDGARTRYERCGSVWEKFHVPEPHIHLNMIGVRPSARGAGLASRLLNYVHELSLNSPHSEGVTLTTEDPTNVPFYSRAGYGIVGHGQIAPGLETWGFFRRDRGSG